MRMRRRPLLRTAALGGGAYVMGKRAAQRSADAAQQEAGQDQRISDLEQSQEPAQAQAPAAGGDQAPAGPAVADQLQQIAAMHEQGVLNDQEFAAAKAKLLGA